MKRILEALSFLLGYFVALTIVLAYCSWESVKHQIKLWRS